MKIAYLDCAAGISGNMFLGALLDLGLPEALLRDELSKLAVQLPEIKIERVRRKGISAVFMEVPKVHEHHHRHLIDIRRIIDQSHLERDVKEKAIQCFENLAKAEAKVHGVSVEEIHFHEVGALDAIIDIVGAAIGVAYFGFERILCSSIRVGFGTVNCAHGEIALPAPATVELLSGFSVYGGEISGEWTTPTGAAILRTWVQPVVSLPAIRNLATGYGAGSTERKISNVLRIISGVEESSGTFDDRQIILETNIDDMNSEFYGYLGERLLESGVSDFYFTPIYMKKNRPATKVSVIVAVDKVAEIENLIFSETTTLGIRKSMVQRTCMERTSMTVEVYDQPIRIKLGTENGKIIKYAPEYEDCRRVARETGRPLREIYEAAGCCARKLTEVEG